MDELGQPLELLRHEAPQIQEAFCVQFLVRAGNIDDTIIGSAEDDHTPTEFRFPFFSFYYSLPPYMEI